MPKDDKKKEEEKRIADAIKKAGDAIPVSKEGDRAIRQKIADKKKDGKK